MVFADVDAAGCGNRGLILIVLAQQVTRLAAHVRQFQHRARQQLMLDTQVVVGIVRHLECRVARGGQGIGAVVDGRGAARDVIEAAVDDGRFLRQGRIAEGVLLPYAVEQAVIEDAKAAANHRLAVACQIVGKAETGTEVGIVVGVDVGAKRRTCHQGRDGLRLSCRQHPWGK